MSADPVRYPDDKCHRPKWMVTMRMVDAFAAEGLRPPLLEWMPVTAPERLLSVLGALAVPVDERGRPAEPVGMLV